MYKKVFTLLLIVFLLLVGCAPATTPAQTTLPVATTALAMTSPADTATATATIIEPTASSNEAPVVLTYPVVDTGQGKCYDANTEIPCPADGDFFGQDAQYIGLEPSFTVNGDGTVTDANTGLVWQQSPDIDGNGTIDAADMLTSPAAGPYCQNLTLGGASDWRLPDIKTLYSLIDFRGTDPSGLTGKVNLTPFLDTTYFDFGYGDAAPGERTIDAQFASSTTYVDIKTGQGVMVFGVNFADGRIKGYPLTNSGDVEKKFYVLCVRAGDGYGVNQFVDNGDGTVSDQATGLVWQKSDSGDPATGAAQGNMDWQDALAYCEGLNLAGHDDWRLPDAKTLQSLVDYSRSPSTSSSAAISAFFNATAIQNETGQIDYPYYWTSTTHADPAGTGSSAVYISFGRALGYMNGAWLDVHGAGAQRSDPKAGNPADYPTGRGPQGDAIRILNYVRCVRAGNVALTPQGNPSSALPSMMVNVIDTQSQSGGQTGGLPGGTPSQPAIAACATNTVGQACHYSVPLIGTVNGICQNFISSDMLKLLACLPTIP